MPKVALLSGVKAKEGKAEELIAAFRPVFELVETEQPRRRRRWERSSPRRS